MGRSQILQFAKKLVGIIKFPDASSIQPGKFHLGCGACQMITQVIAQLVNADPQRTVQDRSEGFVGWNCHLNINCTWLCGDCWLTAASLT